MAAGFMTHAQQSSIGYLYFFPCYYLLPFHMRIDPLRFQAGFSFLFILCCDTFPFWSANVCFCCVSFSFSI